MARHINFCASGITNSSRDTFIFCLTKHEISSCNDIIQL